ncbi:MAG TPA: AI-2E family transporter [Casimicrobiaceae bacterium]|nr:AI-2E family transporter [Casimicrobiaceae bacterium]
MNPQNPGGSVPSQPIEAGAADAPVTPQLGWHHYAWIVAVVAIIAALLHFLGPILTPFLIGATLAYFGSPAVSWAQRHRVPRAIGTLLVVAFILLLVLALLVVLYPLVQAEFVQLSKRLPELAAASFGQIAPWLNDKLGIELQLDLAAVKKLIAEHLSSAQNISLRVIAGVRAGGALLLAILINIALIPVVMFYLLRDWETIVKRIDELLPRRWLPTVRTLAREIDRVLAEFLRGQLSVMGVLAVYYVIGLSLAGLQFAVPIGILTGLLVFVPYVGFGLGFVLGVLAALLQWNGWPGFLAVLSVYGIGQLLEGYVLVPWLVGDRIGLHPLAVIFALLAFGHLFGFAGVLLALPASAALLVGLRHLRGAYHDSLLYQ